MTDRPGTDRLLRARRQPQADDGDPQAARRQLLVLLVIIVGTIFVIAYFATDGFGLTP
jgi:hypothetical protein